MSYQATIDLPLPTGVTRIANQATITAANAASTVSDDPATAGNERPDQDHRRDHGVLEATKRATLAVDADRNDSASPGIRCNTPSRA